MLVVIVMSVVMIGERRGKRDDDDVRDGGIIVEGPVKDRIVVCDALGANAVWYMLEEMLLGEHNGAAATISFVVTGLQPGRATRLPRIGSSTASGACAQVLEKLISSLGAKTGQADTSPSSSVYKHA